MATDAQTAVDRIETFRQAYGDDTGTIIVGLDTGREIAVNVPPSIVAGGLVNLRYEHHPWTGQAATISVAQVVPHAIFGWWTT